VTNNIKAGASLTTFISGFALKDASDNFLAGMRMASQRQLSIGNLIEIDNIESRVI
jgi:small-conductance mechanosensitive channel